MIKDPRMMGRMLMNRGMPPGMGQGGGMPQMQQAQMPQMGMMTTQQGGLSLPPQVPGTAGPPAPGILNGFEMDPKKGLQTPEDMQRLMQFIGGLNGGMVQNPGY